MSCPCACACAEDDSPNGRCRCVTDSCPCTIWADEIWHIPRIIKRGISAYGGIFAGGCGTCEWVSADGREPDAWTAARRHAATSNTAVINALETADDEVV